MRVYLFLLLCCTALNATAATYSYTGNNFDDTQNVPIPAGEYTTAMSVTGEFIVAAPLGNTFNGKIDLIRVSEWTKAQRASYNRHFSVDVKKNE